MPPSGIKPGRTFFCRQNRNTIGCVDPHGAPGLVAAASLSAMALAPTAASARSFGHGGGFGDRFGEGFHHHDFDRGFDYIGGYGEGCYMTRTVLTPFGHRLRTINVCGY